MLSRITATLQARPKGFDERAKREVVTELRAGGVDAFPAIQPSGLLEPGPNRVLKSGIAINGAEVLPREAWLTRKPCCATSLATMSSTTVTSMACTIRKGFGREKRWMSP